jgi:transcriptional regulator with XRE-family HTH domain
MSDVDLADTNRVDVHVGQKVRLRRAFLNMSQEKLGEALGVTFQQIQKYERGVNRIGAGRLFFIAEVLEVPVSFFYEGLITATGAMPGETGQERYFDDLLSSSDGVQLAAAFSRLRSPEVRRKFVDLMKAVSEDANS